MEEEWERKQRKRGRERWGDRGGREAARVLELCVIGIWIEGNERQRLTGKHETQTCRHRWRHRAREVGAPQREGGAPQREGGAPWQAGPGGREGNRGRLPGCI